MAVLHTLQSNDRSEELPPTAKWIVMWGDGPECAFRAFKRRQFNPKCKLDKPKCKCGQGEGAVDNGGPTREFLALLMKELLNSLFFVGPVWRKNLGLDSIGVYMAGQHTY